MPVARDPEGPKNHLCCTVLPCHPAVVTEEGQEQTWVVQEEQRSEYLPHQSSKPCLPLGQATDQSGPDFTCKLGIWESCFFILTKPSDLSENSHHDFCVIVSTSRKAKSSSESNTLQYQAIISQYTQALSNN